MRLFITTNYIIITMMTSIVPAQKDAHFAVARNTIVHLFEWKWNDIAAECENFLQYKGFGGVQISPPNENLIVNKRPWWERYQPVSYKLVTRSGTDSELMDMIRRCNRVGVRIYVDAVINHMTASGGRGTAGSTCTPKNYPMVPYNASDFHTSCSINNYNDAFNVRFCELVGLQDLDQSRENVRERIIEYMNNLIDFGVAGFRIDAAKHMVPSDLQAIYSKLKNLNTSHGFKKNLRPFIYQEVIDYGGEAVNKYEYTSMGAVLEFKYGFELGKAFQGNNKLTYLDSWGEQWGLINGLDAVVFIDNHDNQRTGPREILTYKNPKYYKMAIAFMLAHPYGTTRIMSGYDFHDKDVGPPQNSKEDIVSPGFNLNGTCTNGWICEHRWRQIYNMVKFRNAVFGARISNWWSNGDQQIAFARNGKGFIVFTQKGDIKRSLNTSLPAGVYCDVISGDLIMGKCNGKTVTVDGNGFARIDLLENEEDGVMAIHVQAKL